MANFLRKSRSAGGIWIKDLAALLSIGGFIWVAGVWMGYAASLA